MQCKWFDGYLRNFAELNEELVQAGYASSVRTEEMLEKGYDLWKEKLPLKMNGIFSFGLCDPETDCWFCSRDRFGERSVFYAVDAEGHFHAGKSIREVLESGKIPKKFREDLLEHYLGFSFLPGEDTFYEGIHRVPSANYVSFCNGEVKALPYWEPVFHIDTERTEDEFEEDIYNTVCKALEPFGTGGAAFLSSGVDSSLLVTSLKADDTYTCFFDQSGFDEAETAEATAAKIGAKSHRCFVEPAGYLKAVPEVMRALETPTGDASAVSLYLLCREVAKQEKQCYSGESIDELFFGYYSLRRFMNAPADKPYTDHYMGSTHIMRDEQKKKLLKHFYGKKDDFSFMERPYRVARGQDAVNQAGVCDLMVYLDCSLMPNIENLGEAAGLKIITPYADNRLYELALRIPSEMKVTETFTKHIFRRAAARVLGQETAFLPKRGFPVPIRIWMHDNAYYQVFSEIFQREAAEKFFNTGELMALLDGFATDPEKEYSWRQIWCIYCFLVWYEDAFGEEKTVAKDL